MFLFIISYKFLIYTVSLCSKSSELDTNRIYMYMQREAKERQTKG